MKKILSAAAALVLAAALCLTSCGDEDSSSGSISKAADSSSVSSTVSETESLSDGGGTSEAQESSEAALPADTSVSENSSAESSEPDAEIVPPEDSSESSEPVQSGSLSGKWELEELSSEKMTIKGDILGVPVAVLFQFEFKDDGTVEIMQSEYGKDIKRQSANWQEKDGGISLQNAEGKEITFFALVDGRLTGKLGSSELKLVHVDEFSTVDLSSEPEDDSTPAESLSKEQVVGKWVLYEIREGTLVMKDNFMGTPVSEMIQFTFLEDGTGTATRKEDEETETDAFSWTLSDDTLSVTDEELSQFQLKDGLLVTTFYESGNKVVIKLRKES